MSKQRVEAVVEMEDDTTVFVRIPDWDGRTAVGVDLETMVDINIWTKARLSVLADLTVRSVADLVRSLEGWQNLEPLPESLRVRRREW